MQPITEEITEDFIEAMVDRVINKLSDKLDTLDISLDFIASAITGEAAAALGVRQKGLARHGRPVRTATKPEFE